MYIVTS